jgi:hypothetical protein
MFSSGALLVPDRQYQSAAALSDLPPAGYTQPVTQTAKEALTWDTQGRPATPEHLRPFQHYARQPPGSITRHPYSPALEDVPRDKVFGCRTKASKESAAECMAGHPDSEIGRWKLEQSETVYASVRKEPLGHSPSRGYTLKPEGLGTTIPAGRPLHVRVRGKHQQQHVLTQNCLHASTETSSELL